MKEGRSTLFSDDRRGQTCQQVLRLKRGPSKPQAADGRADAVQESLTWAVADSQKGTPHLLEILLALLISNPRNRGEVVADHFLLFLLPLALHLLLSGLHSSPESMLIDFQPGSSGFGGLSSCTSFSILCMFAHKNLQFHSPYRLLQGHSACLRSCMAKELSILPSSPCSMQARHLRLGKAVDPKEEALAGTNDWPQPFSQPLDMRHYHHAVLFNIN